MRAGGGGGNRLREPPTAGGPCPPQAEAKAEFEAEQAYLKTLSLLSPEEQEKYRQRQSVSFLYMKVCPGCLSPSAWCPCAPARSGHGMQRPCPARAKKQLGEGAGWRDIPGAKLLFGASLALPGVPGCTRSAIRAPSQAAWLHWFLRPRSIQLLAPLSCCHSLCHALLQPPGYDAALERAERAAASGQAVGPAGNGELILVIDDEVVVREITRRVLERFGYRVLLAEGGRSGLATYAAHRGQIRLVLTDLMMPDADGRAVIASLRSGGDAVPIIAVSGLPDLGVGATSLPGATAVLPKPYTADELLRAVQSALGTAV